VFGFQETWLLARYLTVVWSLAREFPAALRTRLVALRLESRTAQGELKLWEKIIRRARRKNVLEVEVLYCGHAAEDEPVRLYWEAEMSPSNAELQWQTSGILFKTIGGRVEYRLRGVGRVGQASTASSELTELLIVLCSFWGPQHAPTVTQAPKGPGRVDGAAAILRISDHASNAASLPVDPGRKREAA
jgi:hypothetical protein